MIKHYASLLAITLATSLALASSDKYQRVRHPSYTHRLDYDQDLLERDLEEELFGREYLDVSDAYVDLEARQPSFFGTIFRDIGKVASTGIHAVEKIAKNPVVQTAAEAAIPGDAELMAAAKIAGKLGKVKKFDKAIKQAKQAKQASQKLDKHLRGAKKVVGRAKKVHKVAKQVHQMASPRNSAHQNAQNKPANKKLMLKINGVLQKVEGALRRFHRHRRDLEDDEELSRRDFDSDVEELFEQEYDDFLAERDDLD